MAGRSDAVRVGLHSKLIFLDSAFHVCSRQRLPAAACASAGIKIVAERRDGSSERRCTPSSPVKTSAKESIAVLFPCRDNSQNCSASACVSNTILDLDRKSVVDGKRV